MQDRSGRESFRSSILPSFYFRNIVRTARPSLVPFEVGTLLYSTLRCSTLQYGMPQYSTVYYTTILNSALQHSVPYCTAVHYTTVRSDILHCTTLHYTAVWCSAVYMLCSTVLKYTTTYTAQCYIILQYSMHHFISCTHMSTHPSISPPLHLSPHLLYPLTIPLSMPLLQEPYCSHPLPDGRSMRLILTIYPAQDHLTGTSYTVLPLLAVFFSGVFLLYCVSRVYLAVWCSPC